MNAQPLVNSAFRVGHAAPDQMQDILRNAMKAIVPYEFQPARAGGQSNRGRATARTLQMASVAQQMRDDGARTKAIAAKLGVSQTYVSKLLQVQL